ncbi:photosystem reaction center protein H [Paracoccus ravus]|uniref:photosystem reaction center protein H n=1 Tax=Paracoccus ravus TaxID=2447760 RepID=UPI00106E6B83|nr:photosystem reaction center protein H [Paracoccus ravus]
MHRLFTTTALVLVLGTSGLQAQTADPATPAEPAMPAATSTDAMPAEITPPDGFMAENVALSPENLDGATVYDATGERIGEVHGLVFADGSTSTDRMDQTAAPGMAQPGPEAPPMSTRGTTEVGGVTGAAVPEPNAGAAGQGEAAQLETDSTNTASGTATADGDAIKNVGHDTVSPTDATSPPTQETGSAVPQASPTAQATPEMQSPPSAAGTDDIAQAVIDVGGFLGMGEHRVAVPVEELVAYRKDTELRIYLPWTREQLMALPKFDMDGPA